MYAFTLSDRSMTDILCFFLSCGDMSCKELWSGKKVIVVGYSAKGLFPSLSIYHEESKSYINFSSAAIFLFLLSRQNTELQCVWYTEKPKWLP